MFSSVSRAWIAGNIIVQPNYLPFRLKEELDPTYEDYKRRKGTKDEIIPDKIDYATGFFTQMTHVTQRTLMNVLRNPMSTVMQVIVMIVFAILVGIIYLQIDDSAKFGIQNRFVHFWP